MTNDTIQTPAGPIAPGHLITYRTFDGARRSATVTAVYSSVGRLGTPGFDADDVTGSPVWGYASQVLTALGDPR